MNLNSEKLEEISRKPLSDVEVKTLLGESCRIVEYQHLDEYSSIEKLLPKKKDYIVLFVGVQNNQDGHYEALIRHNKTIIFFDSYGYRPDKCLDWRPEYMQKKMGQELPYLSFLLNQAVDNGFDVVFNSYPYQNEKDPRISTCGRWCVAVITYFMNSRRPTLIGFNKKIKKLQKKYELSNDLLISRLVN